MILSWSTSFSNKLLNNNYIHVLDPGRYTGCLQNIGHCGVVFNENIPKSKPIIVCTFDGSKQNIFPMILSNRSQGLQLNI